MINKKKDISEIRVEEVHELEDGKHFYRIYKIQEIYELGFLESLDNNITFIDW